MKAKYSYKQVNGINERSLFTTQTFASPVLMQSVMQIDELKVVNPEILRRHGLASHEQL